MSIKMMTVIDSAWIMLAFISIGRGGHLVVLRAYSGCDLRDYSW